MESTHNKTMNDKLLTTEELAEALNVSLRLVKKWLYDGAIPVAIREGKVIRFDLPAVKKVLAKRAAVKQPKESKNPETAMVVVY